MSPALPGRPFSLHLPEDILDDLRRRLEATRFPDRQAGVDWQTGTPLDYARRLHRHWLDRFDWRAWERKINGFQQYMVDLDHPVHVIVEPGSGRAPLPLLLTNGWPSTFVEFLEVIDLLAHPERHGGNQDDAFTVVVPSMPGYGLSPAPSRAVTPVEIAGLWSRLMTDIFGFERYAAFGSDWGSLVTSKLAQDHPRGLTSFMLTTPGGFPAAVAPDTLTDEERAWQAAAERYATQESAYQQVQRTKPQSLAYGQTDSPMGLACWVAEKFHGWTVPGSVDDPPFPMDELLANIMLYWTNGCIAPMWLYMSLGDPSAMAVRPTSVPAAFLQMSKDLVPPAPRSWLERSYNVSRYTVSDGGHFPGFDNRELLVSELREFARPYRN